MVYEYFLDGKNKRICEKKIKYLVALIVGVVFAFLVFYLIFPTFLLIPYAFFIVCSLSLLAPLIAILYYHPWLAKKYLIIFGYFFFVSVCWELSALYIDQWQYLGNHYVGWLQIFDFKLPLEEFIFFWVVYAVAILSWYEFFDDDCK